MNLLLELVYNYLPMPLISGENGSLSGFFHLPCEASLFLKPHPPHTGGNPPQVDRPPAPTASLPSHVAAIYPHHRRPSPVVVVHGPPLPLATPLREKLALVTGKAPVTNQVLQISQER
jgi:hypothetical protein